MRQTSLLQTRLVTRDHSDALATQEILILIVALADETRQRPWIHLAGEAVIPSSLGHSGLGQSS